MLDIFKDSPAYEWMAEDIREESRQQALERFRQVIVTMVSERFPKLERLAKKQVRAANDLDRLQQLLLRCGLTQDATEVEILLLDLDREDES